MKTLANFEVGTGERIAFVLNYRPSHTAMQPAINAEQALLQTQERWLAWSGRCSYQGRWRTQVLRSLITLKALISVTGERPLDEMELARLPGYGGATPVRVGNAAAKQFQLDVYGEVMDTLHRARASGQTGPTRPARTPPPRSS